MEGTYWIRLTVIVGMLLATLWVLLPTYLRGDIQAELDATSASVDTPSSESHDFEVVFDATGDADASSRALRSRLDRAGVPVERVVAKDGAVTVFMKLGAHREDVERLAVQAGVVSLHGRSALGEVVAGAPAPPELSSELAGDLGAVGQLDLAANLVRAVETRVVGGALDVTVTTFAPDLSVTLSGDLPEDTPVALLAIDGLGQGAVVRTTDGYAYRTIVDDTSDDVMNLLLSGPLGGDLAVRTKAPEIDVAPAEAPADDKVVASKIPAWLQGMLPDTAINLGLDLQGGIDLTIEVELEAAVHSQVRRDLTFLEEQAAIEGFPMETDGERGRPVMKLRSERSFADLKAFLEEKTFDYYYLESVNDSDGSEWHVWTIKEARKKEVGDSAVEQVLETLRKRVDVTGVKEPSIVKMGGGRINVQLPGYTNTKAATDAIGTQAVLEFYLVDQTADEAVFDRLLAEAEETLPEGQYNDDDLLNEWLWDSERMSEEQVILWEYGPDAEGTLNERNTWYVLKNKVLLTGSDVNDAGVSWDQTQQPYVALEFKPKGSQIFCQVTTENVGKPFAIVLDGQVRSAPNIRERICGGRASIEMGQSADATNDANTLAVVLRTGSLNAPVIIGNVTSVGPSLGADAIRAGMTGMGIGGFIILLFMGTWYKASGMIANVALVFNVMLVFALLAGFGATLTLPGFAGIALTVGMAVDANIIIYERIREELKLGVKARKAVETGYEKGVVAVVDANVTTAIAGVVLYSYGTGPIKGFAVTLLIGIFTTLVTALFVTRTFMELSTRSSTARLSI